MLIADAVLRYPAPGRCSSMLCFSVQRHSTSAQSVPSVKHLYAYKRVLQVCIFLKLAVPELCDTLYMCALRCVNARPGRCVHQHDYDRRRDASAEACEARKCSEQLFEWLQQKPDVAEAVLTAPCAHQSRAPFTLAQIYFTLPSELHAAAVRGFLGSNASEWRLTVTAPTELRTSMRTLQLLPQQLSVTAVILTADDTCESALCAVFKHLQRATHLTAISIQDETARGRHSALDTWLRKLVPLTGLQRLEVFGCQLSAHWLPDVMVRFPWLLQLTSLVLEGHFMHDAESNSAVARLGPVVLSMTALSRLGLPGVQMGRVGMRALGGALAGLPQLYSLDLSNTVRVDVRHDDDVMSGVAACTALTELDLSCCRLAGRYASVRALCSMQARLRSLSMDHNRALCTAGVCKILAMPSLLRLTRLGLANVGICMQPGNAWPWPQLCKLTALQKLCLRSNDIGDAGAATFATGVSALAHLQQLDIAYCGLTSAGTLARALWRLPRLQQLGCKQEDPMKEPFKVPADAIAPGLKLVPHIEQC